MLLRCSSADRCACLRLTPIINKQMCCSGLSGWHVRTADNSCCGCRASAHHALASPPDRKCMRPAAGADDPAAGSRLSSIVMQYLRQQHRQACLQAPVPIATLPPLSLLAPSAIPEVRTG